MAVSFTGIVATSYRGDCCVLQGRLLCVTGEIAVTGEIPVCYTGDCCVSRGGVGVKRGEVCMLGKWYRGDRGVIIVLQG